MDPDLGKIQVQEINLRNLQRAKFKISNKLVYALVNIKILILNY